MRALEYFIIHTDYFWTWDNEEEVICIRGGSTIAYSQFVIQMLEALVDQGLPPFGALLLAIIATNYTTDDPIGQVEKIVLERTGVMELRSKREAENVMANAIRFLRILSALPLKYTTGDKRVQLFQLLFADCHGRLSGTLSQEILLIIRKSQSTGNDHILRSLSAMQKFDIDIFYDEFRCIALLLKKFPDKDTLIERLAGVPEIEEPVLPDEEQQTGPGDFIQALMEHSTTFPVGSLIKSLWSGMSIPIHHSLPSAQPLGGFSDLSNKGDLDKLLISEFATDDLLFLSRLANNEALYLHREAPPGVDELERIILIDVSLKSWGTPRILAYAVWLAIAKHPKTDIHCTAFAIGNDYHPIEADTVDTVIESIQWVDGALHPAGGLIKFFEQSPVRKKMEVFFIASPDTMRHPAIQKVTSDYYGQFKYWIIAGPEGELAFYRNQHKGRKLIQRLQLPLERLWAQGQGRQRPEPAEETPGRMKSPILFPPPTSPRKVFISSDFELFAVTKERTLLRHRRDGNSSSKGWELIMEDLPPSSTHFAMGPNDNGRQLFLAFKVHNRELTIFEMDTGESKTVFFNEWKPSRFGDFFFMEGEFCYMNDNYLWSFSWKEDIQIGKRAAGDGDIAEAYYRSLQERAENKRSGISFTWPVLKNINRVFINRRGNLAFNKHELVQSGTGTILLNSVAMPTQGMSVVAAEWNSEQNEFVFPGGSTVRVHRSGMLVLRSGTGRRPAVYIPAVLDTTLAAATASHFTGNMFYYPVSPESSLIKVNGAGFYEENIRSFIQDILQCI